MFPGCQLERTLLPLQHRTEDAMVGVDAGDDFAASVSRKSRRVMTYHWRATGWRWTWIGLYSCFYVGAIVAIWFPSWSAACAAIVMFWVSGCLGVTLGYHRLLCHSSFKVHRWTRYVLTVLGCTAFFGGPIEYVGMHRRHHQHADTQDDPHSPKCSLWWAHYEYFFAHHLIDWSRYARDLLRDPGIVAIDKLAIPIGFGALAMLYAAGEIMFQSGLQWLLWAGPMRIVVASHVGGAVNSWTHSAGYRNYDTPDDSRNSRLLGALSFGEGFHNNHHAYPRSAAHGMMRGEIDVTYEIIKVLRKVHLAWDVVEPPAACRAKEFYSHARG